MNAHALVLDVEGTTTPISFVYETLFPFARERLHAFLEAYWDDAVVREDVAGLVAERAREVDQSAPPLEAPSLDAAVAYARWLMDHDRKATPLKSLQGRIWEEGYRTGALVAEVFEDVPRAFARWRAAGREIAIYSSGSVLAQRLLFGHTRAGDLAPFIRDYFDTRVGAKADPASYARIAEALGYEAGDILFVSDVPAELDAARAAGLRTLLALRPGNRPVPETVDHPRVESFDEVFEKSQRDGRE